MVRDQRVARREAQAAAQAAHVEDLQDEVHFLLTGQQRERAGYTEVIAMHHAPVPACTYRLIVPCPLLMVYVSGG